MSTHFTEKVALVTGAGGGLRAAGHDALAVARGVTDTA